MDKLKIQVEGTMIVDPDIDNDDDSSSAASVCNEEEDEEELEVFGHDQHPSLHQDNSSGRKPAIMLEKATLPMNKDHITSSSDSGFGIGYEPLRIPKVLINKEHDHIICSKETTTIEEDDDEFDVLDSVDVKDSRLAIEKALESAASRPLEVTMVTGLEEDDTSSSTSANNIYFDQLHLLTQTISILPKTNGIIDSSDLQNSIILARNSDENNQRISSRQMARQALSEIQEIYGSTDLTTEIEMKTTDGKEIVLGATETIEEGDEDNDDDDDDVNVNENLKQEEEEEEGKNDEWDHLDQQQSLPIPSSDHLNNNIQEEEEKEETKMSYSSLLAYLLSGDLSSSSPLLQTSIQTSSSSSSSGWLSRWTGSSTGRSDLRLSESVLSEPFLLAQIPFQSSNPWHLESLRHVYNFFVSSSSSSHHPVATEEEEVVVVNKVSITGDHWEHIGFQGLDPSTDLNRSMKMLSVLQMLHFIEYDPILANAVYEMSRDDTKGPLSLGKGKGKEERTTLQDRSWPLFCVGISFTKESLQLLRQGCLYDQCNKTGSVWIPLHQMHHSLFADLHRRLSSRPDIHHAIHLADIRKECEKKPMKIFQQYKTNKTQTQSLKTEDEIVKFHDLHTLSPNNPYEQQQQQQQQEDVVKKNIWSHLFRSNKADKFKVDEVT